MFGYRLCISEQSRSTVFGFSSDSNNKSISSPYVGLLHPVDTVKYIAMPNATLMNNYKPVKVYMAN